MSAAKYGRRPALPTRSRNLRPESTLPAFEAGLDNLMNTLETDCGITKDGIVVLSHDPFINPDKESRVDGEPIVGNPLLEQPLKGDDPKTLRIFEFDLPTKKYTGRQWLYRLDPRGTNIGDFQMFDSIKGLIIERGGTQGDVTGFKTVQEIELTAPGPYVKKRLGVDLLKVIDTFRLSLPGLPGDVAIDRSTFGMPFVTIEDLVIFDRKTIGALNDNNYPNSVGRHVGTGKPDDNEFNIIKTDRSLTEPIP
jgi:hypothetical protein